MAVTNTFTPIANSCQTILGCTIDLENNLPITKINNVATTQNTLYNVLPSTLPPNSGPSKLQYFGIGIGGRTFGANKTSPAPVDPQNMSMYTPIPIRCVPESQDLSATDRANLRMRQVIQAPNNLGTYVAYWYQLITFVDTQVQYTKPDTTGVAKPFTLDTSYLKPTPPSVDANGTVIDDSSDIDVGVSTQFNVTGANVLEAINVLYGGDTDLAVISEFGVFSGADIQNTVTDYKGNPFSYTEACMLQMCQHYTWNGTDMAVATRSISGGFTFSSSTLILT